MAQKTSPKSSKQGLQPQPDPRAPVESKLLLQHLTRVMKTLEQDLLERADGSNGLTDALKARHAHDVAAERTADPYDPWRRGVVTQVAASWVLNLVFVRVLEDRGLVDHNRIAGLGAEGSQSEFLKLAPFLTERDYLLTVFRELSHFEVTRELFDPKRNFAFRITPSAEGAKALLHVFRQGSAEAPALRFGQADTRFLGDLYQDLSESVRKKYALLQTPDFIEAFILDRTLNPALEAYGLDDTTLIDPTCGSGHFLLGAFERLFDRHLKERPNQSPREAAHKALGAVFGTDINPYAVSIAKFRLMLDFLDKAGLTKLSSAPEVPLNVVVADSLFHQVASEHPGQTDFAYRPGQKTRDWFDEAFALEEDEKAKAILGRGFAAVVGNPPYITVKDSVLREKYRTQYVSAAGKYALSAPFAERFFQLCRPGAYTGMITANSFMKREFGKKLITDVLSKLDLQLVVNTSGAYIPGHGTPTVLLFGQNRLPASAQVRALLAKRGEPTTPDDPTAGRVWTSIAAHWSELGFEDDFISVMDTERAGLARHPWSLGGGGATELKELLEENAETTLANVTDSVGIASFTLEDDVFLRPRAVWKRGGIPESRLRAMVTGECIRDWAAEEDLVAFFPYDPDFNPINPVDPALSQLWPWRTNLANNKLFGGKTKVEGGLRWYEFGRLTSSKLRTPLTVTFAAVATHNHFVLDRGGKVFKQTAPIIKLPEAANEDEHCALLAYLNSSTACFWMKQVFYPKGSAVRDALTPENNRFDFAGTGLQRIPLPKGYGDGRLAEFGQRAAAAALAKATVSPGAVLLDEHGWHDADSLGSALSRAEETDKKLQRELVALQEEIDWLVYALFGLAALLQTHGWSPINPGDRPFAWSEERAPGNLPDVLRKPFEARRRIIETNAMIAQLENRTMKRLWRGTSGDSGRYGDGYAERFRTSALMWLAGRLENVASSLNVVMTAATFVSVAQRSPRFVAVGAHYLRDGHVDVSALIQRILEGEAVPYLSSLTYTRSGLAKRGVWEETWAMQRREDAGHAVPTILKPPEYSQGSRGKPKDFLEDSYWDLRGKLDVPKERFISYPGCESDEDQSPVYGWAGWNHLERARALAALYDARKEEGWKPERLLPMLVGLLELMPWLKQYHNEPDEAVGGERPAAEFEAFIAGELRQAGKTAQDAEREVLAWAQAGGAKSGGAKAAGTARAKLEDEVPESGTRSSEYPDENDAATASRSAPEARLRKTRGGNNAPPHERDADEGAELASVSRPRAAAATTSSRRGPATQPASKRKKA